jgi:UDP-N-acetylmuramyl pentapeptide synthase
LISDATLNVQPAVLVDDTRVALGQLANHWRQQIKVPVIAITGSNGKTTTKEMLSAILARAAGSKEAVHATQGNLNNEIANAVSVAMTARNVM